MTWRNTSRRADPRVIDLTGRDITRPPARQTLATRLAAWCVLATPCVTLLALIILVSSMLSCVPRS